MFFVVAILPFVHVPTYDACIDNCCKPPKSVDISQVMYLKGSGGLEVHIEDLKKGQIIDFDAVFRDAVNQSTYSVYVGCGGCMPQDAIVIPPVVLAGYETVEIEPFTQTAYRSIFDKTKRTFNTSLLTNCTEGHFTIRLIDHISDRDTPIVWGAVIGLAESFTFTELLEFPVYVLRNHGETWNDLGWTYWVVLFVGAPVYLFLGREMYKACCGCYMPSVYFAYEPNLRDLLYEIAMVGFTAAALEMLIHLIYVQVGNPIGWGFWVGLFVVIMLCNGLPMGFVVCYAQTVHMWWVYCKSILGTSGNRHRVLLPLPLWFWILRWTSCYHDCWNGASQRSCVPCRPKKLYRKRQ
jgi:hypothetical protein